MSKDKNIISLLNPHYFWDVDIAKLNPQKSRRLVIERVFSLGNSKEINRLILFYGNEEVIEQLKTINYLDPKTLNLASRLFQIPKSDFKCYAKIQSRPPLWSS